MSRVMEPDLADLLAGCRAGDEGALTAVVLRFRGIVLGVVRAFRLAPHDAEDVAQVTWGAFADHVDTIRDPDALPAWLARTAHNEAVRMLRIRGREVLVATDAERPSADDPYPSDARATEDERASRAHLVRRAIDSLPDRDRALAVFLLSYPDATYREIGAALDMPIGSIGPIRARAFGRIRRKLEAAGIRTAAIEP
jgi:RNA polymerase sigma factor (sigma-70 family)